MLTPAAAYFNQRNALVASSGRLKTLREAINDPVNLTPPQWAQWFAYALEYKPDLILELGRGNGNSTAAFAEALRQNGKGRLVSLCLTDIWNSSTAPRLARLVKADWFSRIDIRVGNMLTENFDKILADSRRVLVAWDAHGFEIAELVLGRILPLLQDREHFVMMHDVSDLRYAKKSLAYGEAELWKGMHWIEKNNRHDCRLYLGWIDTIVDQAIAVVDFLTRNGSELKSADHSLHQEITGDRLKEMRSLLSGEDFSLVAHWAYFSLEDCRKPLTFPKTRERTPTPRLTKQVSRLKHFLRQHVVPKSPL